MNPLAERFEAIIDDTTHKTALDFYGALVECAEMFHKKNQDYGRSDDPLFNIRKSADVGIEPWRGAYLRFKDKVGRMDVFCQTGKLANEGVIDTLTDMAVYSLICLVLFRENQPA